MQPSRDIARLVEIMAALRDPVTGCPWDLRQDFASIAPYTIEEAYEVADAILRGDRTALRDELGDLLLQVAYHARLAEEENAFSFGDVVEAITTKMIRRHPHVFGDDDARSAGLSPGAWERMKAEERESARGRVGEGLLSDIPVALPALARAVKLQRRAATVGFDWKESGAVLDKLHEEIGELAAEMEAGGNPGRIEDELGDLLFAAANLARHLNIDPDRALRHANAKFERRFAAIEAHFDAADRRLQDVSLAEMEAVWQAVKAKETG